MFSSGAIRGGDLDWAPVEDGGGNDPCVGEVYTEITPCDKGGYHRPTYCCQHSGGVHGCSNSMPCFDTCDGTTITTYVDFSHCYDQTGAGTSGPSNNLPGGGGGSSGGTSTPIGGGSAGDGSGGNGTVTSPIDIQDIDCPPGSGMIKIGNTCQCPEDKILKNDVCVYDYDEDVLEQLKSIVEENPYFLLEINCDQIRNWQNLAQHRAPHDIVTKINNLPSGTFNDFYIQELENAKGTMVNMDYFGVNIVRLPTNPSTGQRYTPDELLDYIRRNFNNFVSGSTFSPYCQIPSMCTQETNLWNSNDPLGAIIYIDIFGDDGVVVCTEYENNYWLFQTMNAPHAGNHPVSGTRQFGYEILANGTYNFYVRGVDRIDSNTIENSVYILTGGSPFAGADNLWESFQNKLQIFVDNNDGNAVRTSPIKNRPDWNKVKDVLQGRKPISDLGCN